MAVHRPTATQERTEMAAASLAPAVRHCRRLGGRALASGQAFGMTKLPGVPRNSNFVKGTIANGDRELLLVDVRLRLDAGASGTDVGWAVSMNIDGTDIALIVNEPGQA